MTDWDDWQTQTVTAVATAGRNQGATAALVTSDTVVGTTEVILATSAVVTLSTYLAMIQVVGWFQYQYPGAGGNATVTVRVRRGTTITGQLIGEANGTSATVAANAIVHHSIQVVDVTQGLTSVQYVLTAISAAPGQNAIQTGLLVLAY